MPSTVVHGLKARKYASVVYLMSGARKELVEAVKRIGTREGVTFGAILYKPFKMTEIQAIGATLDR
jgi:hypothetical protein